MTTSGQCLSGEIPPFRLTDTFGAGIYWGQCRLCHAVIQRIQQAIFGMHHFQTRWTGTDFTITLDAPSAVQATLLRSTEMKLAHGQTARII